MSKSILGKEMLINDEPCFVIQADRDKGISIACISNPDITPGCINRSQFFVRASQYMNRHEASELWCRYYDTLYTQIAQMLEDEELPNIQCRLRTKAVYIRHPNYHVGLTFSCAFK